MLGLLSAVGLKFLDRGGRLAPARLAAQGAGATP
jgi:hypothetical protein